MSAHARSRWTPRIVMWGAIGGSMALLGVLLLLGLNGGAWTIAGAVLLGSCVIVCIWAGHEGTIAEREVRDAVARLAATRQHDQIRDR
ncbi:MAG: hypothetical protein AB7V43_18690 [Acidimicrobiia bacterium]